jgi:hypothetical protein
MAEGRVVQGPAGLVGAQTVLDELRRIAGTGDEVLADGDVRVSGGGEPLEHGDAVGALDTEPARGCHGRGVGAGGVGESGIERDRR